MFEHASDLVKGSWRYASGLRAFLSTTIELEDAKSILINQRRRREETFLRVLQEGIYERESSPYRRLLLHGGLKFDDVRSLVQSEGLEKALDQLYDRGVYLSLDEFKGRAPIRRPGLDLPVKASDFDNPFLTAHYEGRTGGSRSGGTRVPFDFDFFSHEAAGTLCNLHASGIAGRHLILCQAMPPSAHGLTNLLRVARGGHMPARWFSPNKPAWNRQGLQGRALLSYTLIASHVFGRPIPRPTHLNGGRMDAVVSYIGDAKRLGRQTAVYCGPGQAVRICLAAKESGADISGTAFYGGGEPYTAGKAAVLDEVGAEGIPHYGMVELGNVSFRCGDPSLPDDMHITDDKVVILQRPKELESGIAVQALYHTSLLTSSPKLMLNVESGDYGVIEQRSCGCLWETLGFTTHLHSVRSYEKLTSEGVMFIGSMLYELLEEILPARFGGSPTDYQFVEEEDRGQPRVTLLVSPTVGAIDEEALLATVTRHLGTTYWGQRMAEEWKHAGTLRTRRQTPFLTAAAKILPLHVLGGSQQPPSPGQQGGV